MKKFQSIAFLCSGLFRSKTYSLLSLLIFVSHLSCFAQTYEEGLIITNANDTIKQTIFTYKSKKIDRVKCYTSIIVKDSIGDTTAFFPKDIKGYYKDGSWYRSLNVTGHSRFLKQIVSGKAELYQSMDGEGDLSSYYFRKLPSREFVQLKTDFNTVFLFGYGHNNGHNTGASSPSPSIIGAETFKTSNEPQVMGYFLEYFKECEPVYNKIRMKAYTVSNLKAIFSDYNRCGSLR